MEFSKGAFWKFIFCYFFSSYIINFWTFCQGKLVILGKKGAFLLEKIHGQFPFFGSKKGGF